GNGSWCGGRGGVGRGGGWGGGTASGWAGGGRCVVTEQWRRTGRTGRCYAWTLALVDPDLGDEVHIRDLDVAQLADPDAGVAQQPLHPGDTGHAKLDTTGMYTQVAIRRLKEIHTAMHPARKDRTPGRAEDEE